MAKRKAGRPTIPQEQRRSVRVAIRLTEEEHHTLCQAADGELSDWARVKLLAIAKRQAGAKKQR